MRNYIKRLADLLLEEENRLDRFCMNYAFDQQIFITLSKIAQEGSPAVIKEAIKFFSILIENEDEAYLTNPLFAQSLIEFLQRTARKSDAACENEFVEFLFGIAAKIRSTPSILPVWFTTQEEPITASSEPQRRFGPGSTNTVCIVMV